MFGTSEGQLEPAWKDALGLDNIEASLTLNIILSYIILSYGAGISQVKHGLDKIEADKNCPYHLEVHFKVCSIWLCGHAGELGA